MKTCPVQDFIDYWERGTIWCLGIRVWSDRCQALKCGPDQPGSNLVLTEEFYPLPFHGVEGKGPVPVIVFAIATHMMVHPDSDLIDVLSGQKTLGEARQGADVDYGSE
jgi:hypothetical protein